MDNSINILTPLNIPSQLPLNRKRWVKDEAELADLGVNNNKAYYYHRNLEITTMIEGTKWIWREPKESSEIGLLPNHFIYPDLGIPIETFYIDYQNKEYNFFKVTSISVFDNDLTVTLSNNGKIGKYKNGDVIPSAGKTFEEVMMDIVTETIYPTFVLPSLSLTHNQTSNNSLRETGSTVNLTLTADFNRGQIKGKLVAGIWQPDTDQDKRAGLATDHIIHGVDKDLVNTLNLPTYNVNSGLNNFTALVSYDEGPQPVDNNGDNYNAPYPAGTLSDTTSLTGIYPYFYGVLNDDQDINDINIGTLTKVVNTSSNAVSIPFSGVIGKRLVVMIPSTSALKTKWWVNALNNGNIGAGNLFPFPNTGSYNSPQSFWSGVSYKIYISNATSLDINIELRN